MVMHINPAPVVKSIGISFKKGSGKDESSGKKAGVTKNKFCACWAKPVMDCSEFEDGKCLLEWCG